MKPVYRYLSICILTLQLFVFAPSIALATSTTQLLSDGSVQIDTRCHTREQCIESRQLTGVSGDALAEGFVKSTEATATCAALSEKEHGAEVGFCKAGSAITTNNAFFGKKDFEGIGDFIAYIYSISIGIATTLAVIVIIAAGIQIMTAGGNSSTVGAAKKSIGGAIGGLVLLAASYAILATINPALVNLKQPDVYMINRQLLEPLEVAEEQLCDPDGSGPFGGCPSDQYCMPMAGMSLEESLDGPCDIAAVALVSAPAIVAGGIAAFPTLSTLLEATVTAGKSQVVNYMATIAGKPTLIAKIATLAGSAIRTTVQGAKFAGGAVVLYSANEVTGATDAVTEAIDRFTSARGICQPRQSGLRAGDICSTDPNAGITCANNMPCVTDDRLNDSLSCWGPSAMGFCSSGENGAICEDDSHCKTAEGYKCFEKDWGGSIGVRKTCSDGGEGAYCNDNTVTATGDTDCASGYTCVGNLCTRRPPQEEFDLCYTDDACTNIGRGYACFSLGSDCSIQDNGSNNLGGRVGLCLKSSGWSRDHNTYTDESGVAHWRYPARLQGGVGGMEVLEDGRRFEYNGTNYRTTYSLVWQMLDAFKAQDVRWTINLNSCATTGAGASVITSYTTGIIDYQTNTNNHIVIYNGITHQR